MFINKYEVFRVHEGQEMAYCCFGTGPRINSRLPEALGGLNRGTWRISTLAELSATLPSLTPPKWCRAWCFISVLANLASLIDSEICQFQNFKALFMAEVLWSCHDIDLAQPTQYSVQPNRVSKNPPPKPWPLPDFEPLHISYIFLSTAILMH